MLKKIKDEFSGIPQRDIIILSVIVIITFLPIAHYLVIGGTTTYYLDISIKVCVYLLLALGLNLVIGYTGLLDLGFIGVFGIGAYTAAIMSIHGYHFLISSVVSIMMAMLFRLIIGLPVIRLRGDYLAIATLGFGEMVRIIVNNLDSLTNGPRGLPGVGQKISNIDLGIFSLNSSLEVYIFSLVIIALGVLASYRIEHSRIGRALVAIREDEIAASLMGINVSKLKLFIFVISGIYGAVAGIIYTHHIKFITPNLILFWDSILLVAIVVIGGIGSIPGTIVGAILFYGVPELLRDFLGSQLAEFRMLTFGIIMLLMIIFRPQGLIPSERRKYELKPETYKIKEEEDENLFDLEKK